MNRPMIFLSHGTPDDDFVNALDVRLTARGLHVINDARSFALGDSVVQDVFDNGIGKADACVLVLSRDSMNRPWPREELDASVVQAITRGMKLIAILLDDIDVPVALQHRLYYKVGDRSDPEEIERIALRIELAVRGMDGVSEDVPALAESREAQRVKRELLVRLQGHFENLRPLFFHRGVDVKRWESAHKEIFDRAMQADVNDALGADYLSFMAALRAEAKSIHIEEQHQREYTARIVDENGALRPGSERAKREYQALFLQNLAETILTYCPFVSAFGDPAMAKDYQRSAMQWHTLALHMLSQL